MRARIRSALSGPGADYEAGAIGAGSGANADGKDLPGTPEADQLAVGKAFFNSKFGEIALNHYILPSAVLPEIVRSLKPFLKGGIPLLQSDLTIDRFVLPRIQDSIDSDGINDHITALKAASARMQSAGSSKDLKAAVDAYSQEYNTLLNAFRYMKTADIVDPQFGVMKTDLDTTISKLMGGAFSNSAEMSKLQKMSAEILTARAAFDKGASAYEDTLALWATALEVPTPGSLAFYMGACLYCNQSAIASSPNDTFPNVDPTKGQMAVQVTAKQINSILAQDFKEHGMEFCFDPGFNFQSCAFNPPGSKQAKIVMQQAPQIVWDPNFRDGKGGFYIHTGPIVPTNVADGVLDGIDDVKFYIRTEPSTDPKDPTKNGSQLNFSVYAPIATFKAQKNSTNSIQSQFANFLPQVGNQLAQRTQAVTQTITLNLVQDWLASAQKYYGKKGKLFEVPDNAVTFTNTERSAAGYTVYANPHLQDTKPDVESPEAAAKP